MINLNAPKKFSPKEEVKIVGLNAIELASKSRPDDMIKLYATLEQSKKVGPLLKELAKRRLSYHIVEEEELAKISGTERHQNICLVMKQKPIISWAEFIKLAPACSVALPDVENPNNLGAILRSIAHFGVPYVLSTNPRALTTASAYRVAQGAQELVQLVELPGPRELQQYALANKIKIIATSGKGKTNLYRLTATNNWCLMMGSEVDGLSNDYLKVSTDQIFIPGSDKIESLNVSVAAGIVLSELYRNNLIKI